MAIAQAAPAEMATELAALQEIAEHPRDEGVFYSGYRLPDYEKISGEPTVEFGTAEQQGNYGETFLDRWKMNDEAGTGYMVLRCLAANPRSSVWVIKDTALGTQPEGLNTDVARKLMGMGFNVLIKGPEIGSSLPQSQSAYNTHLILSKLEELGILDAQLIAVEGYSRGSMIGLGTNAYAKFFNRLVIYSNLTDPCVALPIKPSLETAKKAAALPIDLGLLALSVAKSGLHPARARHLLRTVDLSPGGARQFYRTGVPLLNGEAGMMAGQTPEDMKATIAFFRHCGWNDERFFRQILAGRQWVRFVRPEGGHGGGIDERIIGNIAVRFGRLGKQLQEQRSPDELDYGYIIHGLKAVA